MVSSWCSAKSILLFSGALLLFIWLGQNNGTWGLSRGHTASWAVLLVPSVLCSSQMGAVARTALTLSKAATGPSTMAGGLSPFWRVTCPCREVGCMLPRRRVLGWCSPRPQKKCIGWSSGLQVQTKSQPRVGANAFPALGAFPGRQEVGTSFLSVNVACASPKA